MPELLTESDLQTAATYARRMDDGPLADKLLRAIDVDPVAVTLREILQVLQASREDQRRMVEAQTQMGLRLGEMAVALNELRHDLTDDDSPPLVTGEAPPPPVIVPVPEPSIMSRCMTLVEQRFDSLRNLIVILAAFAAGGGVASQALYLLLGVEPVEQGITLPLPVTAPLPVPDIRVSMPAPSAGEPVETE